MLLEPDSEASLGLSDVDLSTRAWYLVHDVRLLLDGERVFDLSEHGPESRARPKHHFDVVVPARLSDPLTNACYIRQHHQRRLALSLGVTFSRLAFLRCCCDAIPTVRHAAREGLHEGTIESRSREGPPLWCLAAEWLSFSRTFTSTPSEIPYMIILFLLHTLPLHFLLDTV